MSIPLHFNLSVMAAIVVLVVSNLSVCNNCVCRCYRSKAKLALSMKCWVRACVDMLFYRVYRLREWPLVRLLISVRATCCSCGLRGNGRLKGLAGDVVTLLRTSRVTCLRCRLSVVLF